MNEQMKRIMSILMCRLENQGFKKKRYDYFVRKIDKNTIQNIGFTCTTHGEKNVLYLSPNIGIIYTDVSKLELQLRNLGQSKYPDYVGAMICSLVGYLMPANAYIEWKFSINEDVEKEANAMTDAIIKYGVPYVEGLANRDEAIYGLEIGKYGGEREFILPILYFLRGNNKRALESIDEFIKKLSEFPSQEEHERLKEAIGSAREIYIANNGLRYYLEFAENFKQMLK